MYFYVHLFIFYNNFFLNLSDKIRYQ